MTIFFFIVSIIFMVAALGIIVLNWGCFFQWRKNKRLGIDQSISMILVVSVILCLLAYWSYPGERGWWILLLPCLDIGNLYLVGWGMMRVVSSFKK